MPTGWDPSPKLIGHIGEATLHPLEGWICRFEHPSVVEAQPPSLHFHDLGGGFDAWGELTGWMAFPVMSSFWDLIPLPSGDHP
jgi:hypothetical protein